MTSSLLRISLALGLAASSPAAAVAAASPTIVTPSTIAYVDGTGPDAGAKVAILDGNPNKRGPYTIRLKLPAGARFGPHWHDDAERVTVISGTMLVGMGDKMVIATMKLLPAGSFVVVPAKMHHYAMAQGATVLQIEGMGPSTTTMVGAHK